jgi:hypothetical protein
MGALSWARGVIADTGQVAPIPVTVEDGPDGCFLVVGANSGTSRIHVDRRPNPAPHPILKEIHSCEVTGRHLEAESPEALQRKVAALLEGVAPARELPLAYFRAPAAGYELPVYEDDGQIVAHAFGAQRSRARDLAGMRAHVSSHLLGAGYVASEDDVEVGWVDPADLSLVRPCAIFRSLEDPDVWIPWIDRGDSPGPAVDRLGLDAPEAGNDVLSLLGWVREQIGGGLFASRITARAWRAAERASSPAERTITAELAGGDAMRLELPVLRTRDGALAVALDCGGVDAFVADSAEALADQVRVRLDQCGFSARAVSVA